MTLPVSTLIETAVGALAAGGNPLTLAALKDPIANRLISLSAESGTVATSSTYPGRDIYQTFTDEANGAIYSPIDLSPFARLDVNTIRTIESKTTADTRRRGFRLPPAAIRDKAAITIGCVVRHMAAATHTEYLLGSTIDNNTNTVLAISRAATSGTMTLTARHGNAAPNSETKYEALQPTAVPVGEWFALVATVDYFGGSVRLRTIRSIAANDSDSGLIPAFTGQTGSNSGTVLTTQGLGLGSNTGASNQTTNDASKYEGGLHRFDLWGSLVGEVKYSGSQLTPLSILSERYRSLCNLLNG